MDALMALSGTLANVAAVLLGGVAGLLLGRRLPEQVQRTLLQALSLVTLFIGMDMAWSLRELAFGPVPGVVVGLVAMVLGAVAGELLGIEDALSRVGERTQRRLRGGGRFTEGFVAATLLFCVGPMTIIGGLQSGLTGDPTTYLLKSGLDLVAAAALAGVYGSGVLVSALSVLAVQGGLALGAFALAGSLLSGLDPVSLRGHPVMLTLTGTGGLMLLGIGWNLMLGGLELGERRVRVGSFLPALLLGPLLAWTLGMVWS